jgi:hypothetical protein
MGTKNQIHGNMSINRCCSSILFPVYQKVSYCFGNENENVPKIQVTYMMVRNNIELEYATPSGLDMLPMTGHGNALNFLHI